MSSKKKSSAPPSLPAEPPANPSKLRRAWAELVALVDKLTQTINNLEAQNLTLQGEVENQRNEADNFRVRLAIAEADGPEAADVHAEARRLQGETGALPMGIRLALASGSKQLLGPLAAQVDATEVRIRGIEASLESVEGKLPKGKLEAALAKAKKVLETDRKRLEEARGGFEKCVEDTAEEISAALAKQKREYDAIIAKACRQEPGAMDGVCAAAGELTNRGDLAVGDEVEMQHGSAIKRARVTRANADGTYDLDVWVVQNDGKAGYKEGYDVHEAYQQRAAGVARQRLTKLGEKDVQPAPRDAPDDPRDPKVLAFLYEEAAKTKTLLDKTVAEGVVAVNRQAGSRNKDQKSDAKGTLKRNQNSVKRVRALLRAGDDEAAAEAEAALEEVVQIVHGCEAMVAPLKAQERAIYKSLDKYRGRFDRLTDLARTTIKCSTLWAVQAMLRWLKTQEGRTLRVLRIKNRLNPAFDASLTGGYRDLLVNVHFPATNHIAEIQITLTGLLDVKKSGGHTMYKAARLLDLMEPAVAEHVGVADADVRRKVGKGVVKGLDLSGTEVGREELAELVSPRCLAMQTCTLTALTLSGCRGAVKGADIASILTDGVLAQVGPTLRELALSVLDLKGRIPAALGTECEALEVLDLNRNKLEGGIPKELGGMKSLKVLILRYNEGLTGSIPKELGGLKRLEELELEKCGLTGTIPKELGGLESLKKMLLFGNKLTGEIPETLGKLKKLEELHLNSNQLTGQIPKALGGLESLKEMRLFTNKLTGEIPEALGKLKKLEMLDLVRNQLTGQIPKALGGLESLKVMKLFTNKLTGEIPETLGKLKKLEELYLSDNQLTGQIPTELSNIESLGTLWLDGHHTGKAELRAAFGKERISKMATFKID